MDHVTEIGVDGRLVPPIYHVWTAWEQGDRPAAIAQFQQLLSEELGSPALSAHRVGSALFAHTFPALLQRILAEPLALQAPPASVAKVVWLQAPRDAVLRSIALGDLRWSDDPFETDTQDTPAAEQLAETLRSAERAGLLSRNPDDVPFGGRPVASRELQSVLDPPKLGAVYDVLSIPDPKPADAATWWQTAAEQMPRFTLRTFLHDAYRAEDGRTGDPQYTWTRIVEKHPAYAHAVRTAWSTADAVDDATWRQAARYVARVPADRLRVELAHLLS